MDTNIWEPLFYDKWEIRYKNVYNGVNIKKIKYDNLKNNSKYEFTTSVNACTIFNTIFNKYLIPRLNVVPNPVFTPRTKLVYKSSIVTFDTG